MAKDAETITNYSTPSYVLAGWTPELAPLLLAQLPATLTIPVGGDAELSTDAAAEPDPSYQWFKDGQPLAGETNPTLKLTAAVAASSGAYSVSVTNSVGMVMSSQTTVSVGAAGTQPVASGSAGRTAAGGAGAGGLGTQAGNTIAGTRASAAGQSGADSPSQLSAAGAGGARQPSAGVVAAAASDNGTAVSSRHRGGCSVGAKPGAGGAWLSLPVALGIRRWTRRRRGGRYLQVR